MSSTPVIDRSASAERDLTGEIANPSYRPLEETRERFETDRERVQAARHELAGKRPIEGFLISCV